MQHYFLVQEKKILNRSKSKIFPIKNLDEISAPELYLIHLNQLNQPKPPKPKVQTKKSKHKIYPLKFHENFMNKIENDEKI